MNKIIAAVSNTETLKLASGSSAEKIFYLAPNINTLAGVADALHRKNKKLYIHMDMAEGLGKDKFGIKFVKDLGVDGIISTRANIIKSAKDVGLFTVQRFFAIDAHSIETIVETAKNTKPDMIEIMPGIATKVISKIKNKVNIPIIAGGLIETAEEISVAIYSGASAVSTSKCELWASNI